MGRTLRPVGPKGVADKATPAATMHVDSASQHGIAFSQEAL
jgi:hypothetical protein